MSTKLNLKRRIGGGANVIGMVTVIDGFATTSATKNVVVTLRNVIAWSVCALGTPASDEVLSVNNTLSGTADTAEAKIAGTSGSTTLTVTRQGVSKTSGLQFSLIAYGQQ